MIGISTIKNDIDSKMNGDTNIVLTLNGPKLNDNVMILSTPKINSSSMTTLSLTLNGPKLNDNVMILSTPKINSNMITLSLNPIIKDNVDLIVCDCKIVGIAKYMGGGTYLCVHTNLLTLRPKIASEWDYERNAGRPENYTSGSNKIVWWICPVNPCGCHRYPAAIKSRTVIRKKSGKGTNCPYCGNHKFCEHNSFKVVHPEIAAEWDYEMNTDGPENYSPVSGKEVWWICPINPCGCHRYIMQITTRVTMKCKCPYCENRRLCPHNNLLAIHPKIASEWDYERNINRPENYTSGSNETVWWICPVNPCGCHRYQAEIKSRTTIRKESGKGTNCPYCVNQKLCPHNNLLVLYPYIANEWNYEKNDVGPENYAPVSGKKVWWICRNILKHVYKSRIADRTFKNSACPICNESKGERIVSTLLDKYNIEYKRQWVFKDALPNRLYDFKFTYKNIDWIIEYDGYQHFEELPFFHKDTHQFNHNQNIDKIKTFVSHHMRTKMIRIDYTNINEEYIGYHILKAFECEYPVYYSDVELYEWLSSGKIDTALLQKEAPIIYEEIYK
jgi:hypothetical protein